jgi:hypothetical protein
MKAAVAPHCFTDYCLLNHFRSTDLLKKEPEPEGSGSRPRQLFKSSANAGSAGIHHTCGSARSEYGEGHKRHVGAHRPLAVGVRTPLAGGSNAAPQQPERDMDAKPPPETVERDGQ